MAAPILNGYTYNVNSSGFSVALTVPSTTVVGDTLCCMIATTRTSSSNPLAAPSTAWQQTAIMPNGTYGGICVFTYVYQGTEGWTPGTTTLTFTDGSSGTGNMTAWMLDISGPAYIDQFQVAGNDTSSISIPAMTLNQTNDLVIGMWSNEINSGGTPAAITIDSSFTQQGTQQNSSSGSASNIGSVIGTFVNSSTGSTGTMTSTMGSAETWQGAAIAFSSQPIIKLVGAIGTASATSGTSITGAYGQTPTENNLLIAVIDAAGTTATTWAVSGPGGWTQMITAPVGNNASGTSHCGLDVWYKVAAGGDTPPAFTGIGVSGTVHIDCTIFELSGYGPTPLDTQGNYQSGSSTGTITFSVTTGANVTNPGEFAISAFAQERTSATVTWSETTSPSNWNSAYEYPVSGGAALAAQVNYQFNPASGSTLTDGGKFSTDSSAYGAGVIVVITAQATLQGTSSLTCSGALANPNSHKQPAVLDLAAAAAIANPNTIGQPAVLDLAAAAAIVNPNSYQEPETIDLAAAASMNSPDVYQRVSSTALTSLAALTNKILLQPESVALSAAADLVNPHTSLLPQTLDLAALTVLTASATAYLGGVASLSAAAAISNVLSTLILQDTNVSATADATANVTRVWNTVTALSALADLAEPVITALPKTLALTALAEVTLALGTQKITVQNLTALAEVTLALGTQKITVQNLTATAALTNYLTLIAHDQNLTVDATLKANVTRIWNVVTALSAWADIDADLAVQKAVAGLTAAALMNSPNNTIGMAKALSANAGLTSNVIRIWNVGPALSAAALLQAHVTWWGVKSMTARAELSGHPTANAAHLDLAAIAAMADPNLTLSLPRNTTWLSAKAVLRSLVTRPGLTDLIAHSVLTSNHTLGVTVELSALADLSPKFMFRSYAALEALADLTNKGSTGSSTSLLARAVLDAAAGKGSKASLTADALLHGLDVIQGTKTELSSLTELTALASQGMRLQLKAEAATNTPDITLFVTAPLIASALLDTKVLLKSSAELTALAELSNVPAIGSFSSLAAATTMADPLSIMDVTAHLLAHAKEEQLIEAIDAYLEILFDVLQSVSTSLELEWNVGQPMNHPRRLTDQGWISLVQTGKKLGQ